MPRIGLSTTTESPLLIHSYGRELSAAGILEFVNRKLVRAA